ncbi:twitching motility protein PilT [Thermosulfidibacter takaii ABI70S6]|uniref:Twitching motility protein PilT n=1 Tax=Thermosulfidibacter takaii (strain DSM 17441 / JCM 13301 / NBRC 103674 / ABI70S6) TaxID=1298851 RepID=A0A0S3QVG8_THET7|nr:type IV pilus twitching motility protein PilT [Thermosulfidibacter takaii]BAT72326.1 twitching motility protein PilT [Thermosulfidibacter takaii ABI70S6]
MQLVELLSIAEKAVKLRASDIHLRVNQRPIFRIDGELVVQEDFEVFDLNKLKNLVENILPENKKRDLEKQGSADFALSLSGIGRFRVNLFLQRGSYALAMRYVPFDVPDFEELNLPPVVKKLADQERRGLILVTGVTGSGKSTTLASMLKHIARTRAVNIITIEDPIEYLISDDKAIVSQRELGNDFFNFAHALRAALRQDPDVIMVGEMRDLETIRTALLAAETGHLVLSTLHTLDAKETINRIITAYPPHEHESVRVQLASVLRATISQRLLPKVGGGRVPACEVMINTPAIRECILNPEKFSEIPALIEKGKEAYGTQTFDQSLHDLYKRGLITYEDALANATNRDDFELRIKGIMGTAEMISQEMNM